MTSLYALVSDAVARRDRAAKVPLTDMQREVLERGAEGVCIRGRWFWSLNGEAVGREVRSLLKRGLLDATYFAGCKAGAWATDAGRALLEAKKEAEAHA